jgi:hypothetical protein
MSILGSCGYITGLHIGFMEAGTEIAKKYSKSMWRLSPSQRNKIIMINKCQIYQIYTKPDIYANYTSYIL